jgi:hypothetical protein
MTDRVAPLRRDSRNPMDEGTNVLHFDYFHGGWVDEEQIGHF